MTPYFAAAVQSAFTGAITFSVVALNANGITADVTAVTMMAIALSYAATLALSVLRNQLVKTLHADKAPELEEAENPWNDPELVENAKDFLSEDAHREANRDFWRRAGRGKASFRDAHWPIVNYIQKG